MEENTQEKNIQYSKLSFEELKALAKKGDAKAQFNLLVHNENDTIIIPTNKVDSVSFDMTPEMQAQMKLYKTVKVLTCEKDDVTAKKDSIIETIQLGEIATNKKIAKIKKDLQIK